LVFGRIVAGARRSGRASPVANAQIAAVVLVHGLSVATRDVADFAGFGVALVNPFEGG
jgi:toxin FitB